MSDYLDINNEELLKDFFSEAEQQVDMLESNILVIENDPENHEAIDEIFRAAHTLKGGSATVEMNELAEFTHKVEDLLDAIRSGSVKVSAEVVDLLLRALDIIKAMLAARSEGSVYSEDVSVIVEELEGLIPNTQKPAKKAPLSSKALPSSHSGMRPSTSLHSQGLRVVSPSSDTLPALTASDLNALSMPFTEYEIFELRDAVPRGETAYVVKVVFDESNVMNTVGGIQVFAALKQHAQILRTIPDFDELYADQFHETVYYFVSTDVSADILQKTASIDDVTLSTDIKVMDFAVLAESMGVPELSEEVSDLSSKNETLLAQVPEEGEPDEQQSYAEGEQVASEANAEKGVVQQQVAAPKKNVAPGSILRVDSRRIDYLMNLVSETVIVKASFNQSSTQFSQLFAEFQQNEVAYREKVRGLIDQLPNLVAELQEGYSAKDLKRRLNEEYASLFELFSNYSSSMKVAINRYRSASQNLGRIAGELQEGVMKIRMVPINQIFNRFPRVVRDLSRELNKKINLAIEGEDTELDKSVVEDLIDPIMHCVRNSIDHGIEVPEDRLKNGKSDTGTILLKAGNEGNLIVIEIADDGKGIDIDAVKNTAVKRGIIHPGKMLTDTEAYQLIFAPGFSTSAKVSNISGRGVGLDVVRSSIEKLNGSITLFSKPGEGSRFIIRLPLTLAIIQGLLVRVDKEVYSIPIASVIESQRIEKEDIKMIDTHEVLNVREEVISLLRLNRLFGLHSAEQSKYAYVVIVGTAEKKVGLMVDSLIGEEDVVIKPLRDHFTNSPGIAGASILGDGSVSLIIDVSQLLDLGLKQGARARMQHNAL